MIKLISERTKSTNYRAKVPKKITLQKGKLFNPNSSPTPSPLKRVRKLYSDLYQVTVEAEETVARLDIPQLDAGRVFFTGASEASSAVNMQNWDGKIDAAEFKTPTVHFVPRRPKRFGP
jgi:hypothetical protein